MPLFSQPTPTETAKEAARSIRSDQRGIDREVQRLKREEHKVEQQIKAAAKQPGGEVNARVLAKSLVRIREQIARMTKTSAHVGSVATSVQIGASTATVGASMASATKVMTAVNKSMDQSRITETMQQFEMQNEKMSIAEQMIDDAIESLDDEDAWEEEDETLAMVMDELGLDVKSQMGSAPQTSARIATADSGKLEQAAAANVASIS